jgi:hypothetical protein
MPRRVISMAIVATVAVLLANRVPMIFQFTGRGA